MKFKIMLGLTLCSALMMFTSCENNNKEIPTEYDEKYEIYLLAKEEGYNGSYQEWLNSIKGADGVDGREIELSVINNKIVWRYVGENSWKNIYSINNLIGPKGEDGLTPHIGENGNWFIGDEDTGINAGSGEGTPGESAYDIYCNAHPEYNGTEEQWVEDLVSGNLLQKKFTVEFNTNGGSAIEAIEVIKGNKIPRPADPIKQGYGFAGWYVGNEEWKFIGYPVTENIVLEAHWVEEKSTLTLIESENKDPIISEHKTNSEVELPILIGNSTNSFVGWVDETGKMVDNPFIIERDTTLTAKWEAIENKTIVFYHTMNNKYQEILQLAINSFEAKYPGWKIDQRSIGGYDQVRDAIVGDLQVEAQPDLAYCYPDHVALYMQTKKVVDLSKFINSTGTVNTLVDGVNKQLPIGYTESEIKNFVPGYYNEGKGSNFADYEKYGYTADSMLSMPFVKSTEVLYYNADALKDTKIIDNLAADFRASHVKNGSIVAPTTWDELWTISRAVKKAYPKSTPLGYDSEANWVICMDAQNDWGYTSATGNHYIFNNQDNINLLTDLNKKYKEEKLFTTKTFYNGYTSNLFKKGYKEGSTFSIGSSGGAAHQATKDFSWGVAPLPGSVQADGSVRKDAIYQGPSLTLFDTDSKNSNRKQLMTWLFVKEMLEPKFQAQYSMVSGYNPANTKAFSIPVYEDFLSDKTNIKGVTAGVAKDMSEDYFVSPQFVGSSTALDQIGAAFIHAVNGTKSPAQALRDAANNCGA